MYESQLYCDLLRRDIVLYTITQKTVCWTLRVRCAATGALADIMAFTAAMV